MIFGFDFDDTFTAAPDLMRQWVEAAVKQGHTCVLVTFRCKDDADEIRELAGDMPTVYCGDEPSSDDPIWKRDVARRAGYNVDVWIDDSPQYICPNF